MDQDRSPVCAVLLLWVTNLYVEGGDENDSGLYVTFAWWMSCGHVVVPCVSAAVVSCADGVRGRAGNMKLHILHHFQEARLT